MRPSCNSTKSGFTKTIWSAPAEERASKRWRTICASLHVRPPSSLRRTKASQPKWSFIKVISSVPSESALMRG